jgi:CHAD domain-containing protein
VAADSNKQMPAYAALQGAARLDRLAYELGRAGKASTPDAVHDLRVGIRRFESCLRLFKDYFPRKEAKKIRKRLRDLLDLAGRVRDRDIALALGRQAGLSPESSLLRAWAQQRKQAAQELMPALRRAVKNDLSTKWRSRLKLVKR